MKLKQSIIAIYVTIISLCMVIMCNLDKTFLYGNIYPRQFDAIILKFDKTTTEMLVKVTDGGSSPFDEGDKVRTKYVTEYGQIRPRKRLSICIEYWEEDQSEMTDSDNEEILYIKPDRIYRNAQYIDGEWKPANY